MNRATAFWRALPARTLLGVALVEPHTGIELIPTEPAETPKPVIQGDLPGVIGTPDPECVKYPTEGRLKVQGLANGRYVYGTVKLGSDHRFTGYLYPEDGRPIYVYGAINCKNGLIGAYDSNKNSYQLNLYK